MNALAFKWSNFLKRYRRLTQFFFDFFLYFILLFDFFGGPAFGLQSGVISIVIVPGYGNRFFVLPLYVFGHLL